jgi:uncharacterized protein with HEPN domain
MPSMPSSSLPAALRDILKNIRVARSFIVGLSPSDFLADQRTSYAVVGLEIISEASRRLPPDLKTGHPEIAWSNIADAGNVYRHQYHDVSDELVWQTVQNLEPL